MVYVVSQSGKALMPTSRYGKVRHLLREGKARVVRREPFTKNKRESPRLQSWDESASMFFLILDISDYGISRNASDRLAEIRTRP